MNDKTKTGLAIFTLKNPMVLIGAIVVFLFFGLIIFLFFITSFISGNGFEIQSKTTGDENLYCIYNFDDKEYFEVLRTNYNVSKSDAKILLNGSVEGKVDPSVLFAILKQQGTKITKSNIETAASNMYEKYIKEGKFNYSEIIFEMAPMETYKEKNEKGEEVTVREKSSSFINAASEIVNTLKPTMACSTKDMIGEEGLSGGGGIINIGDGLISPPLEGPLRITSNMAYRIHPVTGVPQQHRGVDIACYRGQPILSVMAGVVYTSTVHDSWGNYVLVDHKNGVYTLYAHMDQRYVSTGDKVQAGTILGGCGSTGSSTGYHLHIETQLDRPYGRLVSALDYFGFK